MGSFVNSEMKQNEHDNDSVAQKKFYFKDIDNKGSFVFKNMFLELFLDGRWCFYIEAAGKNSTTLPRNGKHTGPLFNMTLFDEQHHPLSTVALGQVNYDSKDDTPNEYICKGYTINPELIKQIRISYDDFTDYEYR